MGHWGMNIHDSVKIDREGWNWIEFIDGRKKQNKTKTLHWIIACTNETIWRVDTSKINKQHFFYSSTCNFFHECSQIYALKSFTRKWKEHPKKNWFACDSSGERWLSKENIFQQLNKIDASWKHTHTHTHTHSKNHLIQFSSSNLNMNSILSRG